MNLGEHRIFKHMSAPFRIVGINTDEAGIGLVGVIGVFFIGNKMVGLSVLVGSVVGVWGWKKIKKQTAGFSVVSFVNWYFGPHAAQIDPEWVPSYERRWLI